jgi:hypothetical protein
MTIEERKADEAGASSVAEEVLGTGVWSDEGVRGQMKLRMVEALVACKEVAVAEEREACALEVEKFKTIIDYPGWCNDMAKAIRARGQA